MTIRTAWRLCGAAALALGAAPAVAQDFCGGISANGQWIGGTEAASDVSAAEAHMEQMALVLQNNQYVALFSASGPTEVRLEAQGRGAGDPTLELRNEAGAVVTTDDDSGGSGAARIETALEPGRYCLTMTSYDGSPMTGFVRVGRAEHEALTAGMDAPVAPADPMAPDKSLPYGGICDASTITRFLTEAPIDAQIAQGPVSQTASVTEVPYWGFTLSQPTTLTITAENESADPVVVLYDQHGDYLGENDDWSGLNARLDMALPLQPGTYCIAMNAWRDVGLPITVSVSAYDAQAAQIGMYERAEAAPPLDGSYPVTGLGTLTGRYRTDVQSTDATTWFSFDVPQAGVVLIEAVTNNMGDPMLVLFDDFGREVAYNYDHGPTLDSLIAARVLPGTYLVGVRQMEPGAPVLTRMLFERYVPAQ